MMTALVVPFICNPLTAQLINRSSEHHDHLLGLELADSADASDLGRVNRIRLLLEFRHRKSNSR